MHRKDSEPKLLPSWLVFLVFPAGMLSLVLGGIGAKIIGCTGAVIGIAYFVQSWRHAGWVTRNR